jgi:beta-glucosidase
MTGYNRLNGTWCGEHEGLFRILRDEWGFDGFVLSDWYAATSVESARAGLDLEMPGPPQWFGPNLAAAVRAGDVEEAVLDDKAWQLLALLDRAGALDGSEPGPEQSIDDPEDRAVIRRAATESFVLLHNRSSRRPTTGRSSR